MSCGGAGGRAVLRFDAGGLWLWTAVPGASDGDLRGRCAKCRRLRGAALASGPPAAWGTRAHEALADQPAARKG
jgi:hypothetical protein